MRGCVQCRFTVDDYGEGHHAPDCPTQEPAGSGATLANGFNMLRIAEEITRGVGSMSKHATATGVSMWVRSVLEREFGSPRKVGEDGAQTFEQWWQAEGVHMVRTTHRTGYELMKEAWNAARPYL